MSKGGMTVGLAGAGSVAFGTACFLLHHGHRPMLWSPSGSRTRDLSAGKALVASKGIEGEFKPAVANDAAHLAAENDILMLVVPGYAHKTVMDALIPHIGPHHSVIISSHASLGALYLRRELARRGRTIPVIAWGTTLITGRQPDTCSVQINTVRSQIDFCVLPADRTEEAQSLCECLFGQRFVARDGLLAISLSNLNPQNHMGIALANMTRMERGESWSQAQNVTPAVGALLEALDLERLAIAGALGLSVRTIFEHFHLSFHVPIASISTMNQAMHAQGNGGVGPATADSRYVTEDVPYGLVVTARLGRMVGKPAPLHEAGIALFSAMYRRDFTSENELLPALELDKMTLEELREVCFFGSLP